MLHNVVCKRIELIALLTPLYMYQVGKHSSLTVIVENSETILSR